MTRNLIPFDVPGHDDDDDAQTPVVPFVPFRCPFCGRNKPRTSDVHGRLRRHRCQACGRRYRSWEMPPDCIPNWTSPPESHSE